MYPANYRRDGFLNNPQALGRGCADIYSLGMTIWCVMRLVTRPEERITQRRPHPDDHPQPHPLNSKEFMPPRAISGMRRYSLDLEELVTACLSWKPQDRPSASDLVLRINSGLQIRTRVQSYQANINARRLRPPMPSAANRDSLRLQRRDPVGDPPAPGALPNEIQLCPPISGQWPPEWQARVVPDAFTVGGMAPVTAFRQARLQNSEGRLMDPRNAIIAMKRRKAPGAGDTVPPTAQTWMGVRLRNASAIR